MESFGSWIKNASPQLPRKQKSESSAKFLHDEKKLAQKELLAKLELRLSNDAKKDEQTKLEAARSESAMKELKSEGVKLKTIQKTMKSVQEMVSKSTKELANLKYDFSKKKLKSDNLQKNDELMNECREENKRFDLFCLSREQEISNLRKRITAKSSENTKSALKETASKMKLVKKGAEKIRELRSIVSKVDAEIKEGKKKEAILKDTLQEEVDLMQQEGQLVEQLHEKTADLRSQLVQLEAKESKLSNTYEIDSKIRQAEKTKEFISEELATLSSREIELNQQIESHGNAKNETEKELKKLDGELEKKNKGLDELSQQKLKQFLDEMNRETLRFLVIGMKQEIASEKAEIGRLTTETNELAIGFANSVQSFKSELKMALEHALARKEEMKKMTDEEARLDKQLAVFVSNDSTDSKTPKQPKAGRKKSSQVAKGMLDLTAEMEEWKEASIESSIGASFNTDLTLSPIFKNQQEAKKRRAVGDGNKKTAVKRIVSKDPFEEDERLEPLLTSTPIVGGPRKTTRAAALKARKSFQDDNTPPTMKKAASRGRGGRKRGGKKGAK